MLAERYGRGLLDEVHQENLHELLKSLRHINESPTPANATGITVVDKLLDGSSKHIKPGIEIQLQHTPHSEYGNVRSIPSRRNTIVEIIGAIPSSGKTEILYKIAADYLYPSNRRTFCRPGIDGVVIWIDAGARFSISRFHTVLTNALSESIEQRDESSNLLPILETACLQHIHIFRPQSAESLLATAESLPAYLLGQAPSCSSSCPLRAVIISDISSFYWQIRQEEQLDAGKETVAGAIQEPKRMAHGWRKMVRALRKVQEDFGCSIIASNSLISNLNPGDDNVARSQLPAVWNNFASTKVVLTCVNVQRYRAGISVEEALAENKERRHHNST